MSLDSHVSPTRCYEVETLTERQAERRRSLLVAAAQLAASGGYAAVQIREVAATAGVALGTLYKYFESKDHLLAALSVEWTSELEQGAAGGRTSCTSEQVIDVVGRALDSLWVQPDITRAVLTALNSSSDPVAECQVELSRKMGRVLAGAFQEPVDPGWQDQAIRAIEHVWFSALRSWANGWMDPTEVKRDVESAVRLILEPAVAH